MGRRRETLLPFELLSKTQKKQVVSRYAALVARFPVSLNGSRQGLHRFIVARNRLRQELGIKREALTMAVIEHGKKQGLSQVEISKMFRISFDALRRNEKALMALGVIRETTTEARERRFREARAIHKKIRRIIGKNPGLGPSELLPLVREAGINVSRNVVANVRELMLRDGSTPKTRRFLTTMEKRMLHKRLLDGLERREIVAMGFRVNSIDDVIRTASAKFKAQVRENRQARRLLIAAGRTTPTRAYKKKKPRARRNRAPSRRGKR